MSARLSITLELLAKTRDALIFSPALVPPVLDGSKTVTRRLSPRCARWKQGDLIWVRETLRRDHAGEWMYGADQELVDVPREQRDRYRLFVAWSERQRLAARELCVSIHLPRWATRCVLRLTEDVRVEQVQAVDEQDARLEGVESDAFYPDSGFPLSIGYAFGAKDGKCPLYPTRREAFAAKWRELHTAPGQTWDDNPRVARIAFERIA